MRCTYTFDMNNLIEEYEFGKVAKQANGAVLLKSGNSVLLATAVLDEKPVDEDFLPLTVQYIEKSYAVGKIPGGFVKREQKPSDFETLTSRIVDRALRPAFPKGFNYPVVINVMVLSADEESDLQVLALHAASAALYASNIDVEMAVGCVRVAKIDGEIVLNPSFSDLQDSTLDLFLAGNKEDLLMIEMKSNQSIDTQMIDPLIEPPLVSEAVFDIQANEMSEESLIEAIELGMEAIGVACVEYEKHFAQNKKEPLKLPLTSTQLNDNISVYIDEFYKEEIGEAISKMASSERNTELESIAKQIAQDEVAKEWSSEAIMEAVFAYKREAVRAMILDKSVRADGRGLKDVRNISIETNILPNAHSSCLFTRGQTQALAVATLGNNKDAQMFENLTDKTSQLESFMIHYNFPPFSVGEADRIGPPGRRELGHGNLAKRALEPVLLKEDSQTIRIVSEILESNGSSSMATVCASALAIRACDVELTSLVAGVAMGLVSDGERYAILTDIMGLEDHDGDMDFKIAGTLKGITALQMDIKLGGLKLEILKEALLQAKEAKEHILGLMSEAESEIVLNENNLPSSHTVDIHPSSVADIIGQAGKTIKEIIEKFEVSIDIDRDKGKVKVSGSNKPKVMSACEYVAKIASKEKPKMPSFEVGKRYKGKVKRIADFGAFVEIAEGVDGLLHISKLSRERVNKVTDVVNVGDEIEVILVSQKGHKIELSLV